MAEELIKRSENAPSKEKITAFVHDMKEIESKQFALEKIKERCQSERCDLANKVDRDLNYAEERFQHAKKTLNEAMQNRKEKPKEVQEPKERREPMGFHYLPLYFFPGLPLLLSLPVALIVHFQIPYTEKEIFILVLLSFALLFGLFIINRKIAMTRYEDYQDQLRKYNQYQKDLSEHQRGENEIAKSEKALSLAEKSLESAKKKKAETAPQLAKLDETTQFLATQISEIEKNKQKLYSLNIVPPDYRELDCLIEFDQIFRNDLADTMREAVMIYERRVANGEIIQGIQKIYHMLGELVATMRNIESALYSIQSEVRLMSDDLFKFASSYEKSQESLLSETRAARYATEALQQTQERCEWYMNRSYWNT